MPDAWSMWLLFKDSTALQAVIGALIGFLVMQLFQKRKGGMPDLPPMDERFMPGYRGGSVPLPKDLPFGPAASKQQKKPQKQQQKPQQKQELDAAARKRAEMERKLLELMAEDEDGEEEEESEEEEEDEEENLATNTRESEQQLRRRRQPLQQRQQQLISGDSGSESDVDEEKEDEEEAEAAAEARASKKRATAARQSKKREDAGSDEEVDEEEDADLGMVPYANVSFPEAKMLDRACKFYELMRRRRSCRQFSDRPVPAELVQQLVLTAGTSPSGAHTEPWTYVVVTDRLLRRRIREIVEEEEEINYARRMGPAWKADLEKLRTNWEKPYLTEAPVVVVLMRQVHGFRPGHGEEAEKRQHYYSEISVSISAGIFLAAVQHAGLCTLTSTPMNAGPALRRLLGRPPNEKVHLLMPLGYAAEDAEVPNLRRKELARVMVSM